jgi:predicted nucleotidyltransferase component of viral defense system
VSSITEGLLVRHYQGTRGARDAALLDIAQDHALYLLWQKGVFDHGLGFKGGTALRKFRAGNTGRFSTDLDFAAPDEDLVLEVFEILTNASFKGFTFHISELGDDGRRGKLEVDTPFGRPNIAAKIELSRHGLILPAEILEPIEMPIHKVYDFRLPALPIVRIEEAVSEKLARYRRVALARDLYDLAWFSTKAFDESLVRRLWILKTYCDIVLEHRGQKPIEPSQILCERNEKEFAREQIGYLTGSIDIPSWVKTVRKRFSFLEELDENERRWATCNPKDEYEVLQNLTLR